MELNAGIATIMRGVNTAEPGEMPNIQYTQEVFKSYYAEKTVGFQRFYTAAANNNQIDMLIEIQPCGAIKPSDRCTLKSFYDDSVSGDYVVIQAQKVTNEDNLPATDLTLQRIETIEGVGA